MAPAIFNLTRNGHCLQSLELGVSCARGEGLVDVNEVQPYGFEVDGREPDTEYAVWIGDIHTGIARQSTETGQGGAGGVARGRFILWEDRDYFEGARGIVWVRLRSRASRSEEAWQERAEIPVAVMSTKLSESRYQAMYEQLRDLASGLVLDLVSKSLRSVRLGGSGSPVSCRSSIVELQILERLWPPIAASLNEIASAPVRKLKAAQVRKQCYGSERFGTRSLMQMAAAGFDPRRSRGGVPFVADVREITESSDTAEHRAIRGFLEFLLRRVTECRENLLRHIQGITDDRRWRERTVAGEPSLYQTEDVPRLARLEEKLRRTERLRQQVANSLQTTPVRAARPVFRITDTPVFRNVAPYRRLQQEMIRYLTTGLVVIDEGFDERVKSTSKMYEQWVFLQLAAALRAAGLRCRSRHGLLHTTRMFRFTLDIDRGARLTFEAGPGRSVSLRYEPWILPEQAAKDTMETVYRGRTGQSSWSPDVLVEILREDAAGDKPSEVEYAIVVDAKYTAAIRDHHWENTNKYLEVRSTRNDRQVVRQLWLAYPGGDAQEPIGMRDPKLRWTDSGPNWHRDEVVQGMLSLLPPVDPGRNPQEAGWIGRPEPAAVQFVSGILAYLGIPCQQGAYSGAQPQAESS